MLQKRKQLINGINSDLAEDIEENTNFLIVKRKNRLKKGSRHSKEKYLYHTINDGYIKGGIMFEGKQTLTEGEISLNQINQNNVSGVVVQQENRLQKLETFQESNNRSNFGNTQKINMSNFVDGEAKNTLQHQSFSSTYQKINASSFNLRRPSTAYKEESFIYQSKAPRIHFSKKNQQDDILSQLNNQPTQKFTSIQLKNDGKQSRNIYSSLGPRRLMNQTNNQISSVMTSNQTGFNQVLNSQRVKSGQYHTNNNFIDRLKYPSRNLKNDEFMTVIQNRGEYRRDKMIQKLKNQVKAQIQSNMADADLDLKPKYETKSQNKTRNIIQPEIIYNQEIESPFQSHQNYQNTRPQSQNMIRIRGPSSRNQARTQVEVQKFSKFLAQTQNDVKSLYATSIQDAVHKIVLTGQDTKGIPDYISPRLKNATQPLSFQSIKSKDYLSTMVSDVVKNRQEHDGNNNNFTMPRSQNKTNQERFKNSIIQIVQKDKDKNEFEVLRSSDQDNENSSPIHGKNQQLSINLKYPFNDNNCRKFVSGKRDIINQLKTQTIQLQNKSSTNTQYNDINQMNQLTLEEFIYQNHLHPMQYYQTFEQQTANQVDKFEFFLVKGNQYLHKEDYNKALRFFQDGLKNYPGSLPYRFNSALINFVNKDYEKAQFMYEQMFQENQEIVSIFYNLLLTLLKQENYQRILSYRDINSFTRPRLLMSQQQMSINKIMIYSASKLGKGETKGEEKLNTQNEKNAEKQLQTIERSDKQISMISFQNQQFEQNLDIQIMKKQDTTPTRQVNFNSKYFQKRELTQHPKKSLRILTQKRGTSLLQHNQVPQKVKKSMIEVFEQEYQKKRQKFDKLLEAKRHVLKDRDNFYQNIDTFITKTSGSSRSFTPQASQRKSQLYFTIAPQKQRTSSLDKIYKELDDLTQAYTKGAKDPIEEKYKELIEDLRVFKQRVDIKKYVKDEIQDLQEIQEQRDRPWLEGHTRKRNDNPMMRSKQMVRARSFIKSAIGAKSKKESIKIAENIENLVESHVRNIQEEIKGIKQRQHEEEIDKTISDLTIQDKVSNPLRDEIGQYELSEIDKSFIVRLEKMKDLSQMTEDQKLMQILGITREDLEKRRDMAQDKLLNVLCPDGVTSEDRENFDKDTDEFLSYLYNNYLIKSAIIPGTEIPHIFRDSLYYESIKKYLEKLSQTISSRLGIFGEDLEIPSETQDQEVKWESPIKNKSTRKKSIYNQILKKGQELDGESTAKSTLAYLFLQKINTMGFLNKIVKENMTRIKKQKKSGFSTNVSSLTLQELKYVEQQMSKQNAKLLRLIDYQLIDNVLQDLKFFSIFERDIRVKIYKIGSYVKVNSEEARIIDSDIEITKYMYVVLSGSVTIMRKDFELGIDIPLTTYKPGDCFGDLSIQSLTVNPYDLLSKNKIFALADENGDPCHLFRFERESFINSIFKEMKDTLYQKIMLLKQATFFEDLSPYALVILASNIQMREYKLGDILIKQGVEPTECFIILEGECRTIFEQDFIKSTKVSRFAKKCLQTDLPQPMHYNGLDYKQLAKLNLPMNENEQEKLMDQAEEHIRKAVQEQNQNKYSFQNEILNQDMLNNKIEYRHHIQFGELKPGNCVGFRTLLDKQLIRRHIIDEAENYSEQLKIYPSTIKNEMASLYCQNKAQPKIDSINSSQKKRKQLSSKNLNRKSKTLKSGQNEEDEQLHINLKLINQIDEATAQVTDLLLENELKENAKIEQKSDSNQLSMAQLKRSDSIFDNRAPSHLAEEITPRRPEEELLTRNQLLIKSRLYDRLMQELLKSQLTVVAHTSTVKVMVVKKDDKNFLNETLKNIIDRKLLEKKFRDIDRPVDNINQILEIVDSEKRWKTYKSKLEIEMLREVAMNKKLNKLLD
eukprot:403335983